jgi:hypothetical protein
MVLRTAFDVGRALRPKEAALFVPGHRGVVYFRHNEETARQAKMLTRDEARRMAVTTDAMARSQSWWH